MGRLSRVPRVLLFGVVAIYLLLPLTGDRALLVRDLLDRACSS